MIDNLKAYLKADAVMRARDERARNTQEAWRAYGMQLQREAFESTRRPLMHELRRAILFRGRSGLRGEDLARYVDDIWSERDRFQNARNVHRYEAWTWGRVRGHIEWHWPIKSGRAA